MLQRSDIDEPLSCPRVDFSWYAVSLSIVLLAASSFLALGFFTSSEEILGLLAWLNG